MGDHDHRPPLGGLMQCFEESHFRCPVQRGGGFVQQQDFCRRQQHAGEAEPAGLADRDGAAAFAHHRVEPLGQGADEVQLSVWSGNTGAQRFYRRYGFEKVADIDFWVGRQRDDEFLFALVL